METLTALTWLGILLCVLQSACFSGLNLALFGISALQLEAQAAAGDEDAGRLLELRRDSNFLLATVLWGNVGTNVLLTLLTDSVLAGAAGFFFSTFVITFGGEIIPQAYFSRNALRMATRMRPFLRFWQTLLYPLAKSTGVMLDAWLGKESIDFLSESELREVMKRSIASPQAEIGRVEGIGSLNFMVMDDLGVHEEGEALDPRSVLELPVEDGRPVFPEFECSRDDAFLRQVDQSGRKWVVLTSHAGDPVRVLDADAFLREALLGSEMPKPLSFCHRPIVVRNPKTPLGEVLPKLRVEREFGGDDVVDKDVILLWSDERMINTGADILGRLLRGIARPVG